MSYAGTDRVKFYALGGLGELGKNLYVIEVGTEIFILDAGLTIPEGEMLGVDVVIPDIKHLLAFGKQIKGIFLTNGHEEHIGSIPYILQKLNVPVYGTKLTLTIVKDKLKEAGISKNIRLYEVNEKTSLPFEHATVNFFETSFIIPGAIGICIETSQGSIVYTGDFKIDQTPVDGRSINFSLLSEMSKKGVLCLLSSCSNAESEGYSQSERVVADEIDDIFESAKSRLIIGASTKNIYRIQQIFDAAYKFNKKIIILGKDKDGIIDSCIKLHYLNIYKNLIISPKELNDTPPEQLVILITGTHNKVLTELSRMASQSHKFMSIFPEDTVLLTDKATPTNEKLVSKTVDILFRTKAKIIYGNKKLYVPAHASSEELKLMLQLLRPKYVVPVNGEVKMQKAYELLALETGMNADDIFLLENGEVLEIQKNLARVTEKVATGNVLIDGIGVGDVGNIVLRDRKLLSEDGIFIVVVTLSKEKGTIISGPEIISRGFVYVRESEELLEESVHLITKLLNDCLADNIKDWSTLKNNMRDVLSRFLFEKTKRRPMLLPIIMEI